MELMLEIIKNDIFSCHYVVCPHNKHIIFMYSIMKSVFRVENICIYKVGLYLERLFYERIRVFFQLIFFLLNVGICTTDKMELSDYL